MRKTYKRYMVTDDCKIAIWDHCNDIVEIRNDGERMRLQIDTMIGDGQGGGSLSCKKFYIDGRKAVKTAWRQYRKNQLALIRNGQSSHHYSVIEGCEYVGIPSISPQLESLYI